MIWVSAKALDIVVHINEQELEGDSPCWTFCPRTKNKPRQSDGAESAAKLAARLPLPLAMTTMKRQSCYYS